MDFWANLLQRLVETLLFYHPAVWWLSRRASLLREMCADELAVEATGERMTYASVLELLGRRRLKLPAPQLAAGIGGRKMALFDRVRNVLGVVPGDERLRWWPAGLLALLVPLGLWLASMGMAETKQQAQVFTAEANATPQPAETGLAAFRSAVSTSFAKLAPAVFAHERCLSVPSERRNKAEADEIARQYRAALDDFQKQVHARWPFAGEDHQKEQEACADADKEIYSLLSRAKGGQLPAIDRHDAVRRMRQIAQEFSGSPLSDQALQLAAHVFEGKRGFEEEECKLWEAAANSTAPLSAFRILAMTDLASMPADTEERLRSRERFAAKMREWHDPLVLEPLLLNPLPMETEEHYFNRVLAALLNIESHYSLNALNMKADADYLHRLEARQPRMVAHLPEWLKPLHGHGLLATLDDNDEVATLTTSGIVNDDLLSRLKTLPKLRELHIEYTNSVTPAGLAHLGELKSLEKLSLSAANADGPRLGDAAIRSVVGLPALRELSVMECGMTDAGAKLLEQMPQLTGLDLYGERRLTDTALESIGKLSRLKSLSLTCYDGSQALGRMGFSAAGIRRLGGLKELETLGLIGHEVPADGLPFPKLTSLSLGHPLVDDAVAARVGELRQLRHLQLSYCLIRDAGLKRIAALPELRQLDISSRRITDEGIESLRAHPRLEHVTLRADVSDKALQYLSQIATLTRLDLYGSGATGVVQGRNFSMAGLQALKALPKLETLWLTNLDLPGGDYTGLKELQQLRVLSFMMCNVSDGELDALEEALPNTHISRANGGDKTRRPKKVRKPTLPPAQSGNSSAAQPRRQRKRT